jgi:3-phenylpropionate/trans-cinnamate dioxygenase ferredoxin subunit
MSFVKVAKTSDLAVGEMKKVFAGKETICLSNIEGDFYAISNVCPHLGGSLADGVLKNGVITCPRHGSKYNAKTGVNVGHATIMFLKFDVKDDRSFVVKIEGDDVLVDVED